MCSSRYASCLWSAGKTWPHCKPISAWKHRARSHSQWQACVRSHRRSISMRRQRLRHADGGSSSAAIGPCEGMTGSIFCRRIFVTSKQANATTFCEAVTDSSALGMKVLTSATSVSEPHSGPVVFRLQAAMRFRIADVPLWLKRIAHGRFHGAPTDASSPTTVNRSGFCDVSTL